MYRMGAERPHTQLWPFCLPPTTVSHSRGLAAMSPLLW